MANPSSRYRLPSLHGFNAYEISAAEQLVQLSESSGEAAEESSSLSTSTSAKSVTARPCHLEILLEEENEEEDESGLPRRNHRFRLLADLYSVTTPINLVLQQRRRNRGEPK